MITTDNIFGTYIYLATCTAALCACFYFEPIFTNFEESSAYSSIGAFVLYPLISYIYINFLLCLYYCISLKGSQKMYF